MWFRRNLPIFIALSVSVALHWVSFRGAQHYQVKLRALTMASGVHQPQETTVQLSLLDPPAPKPDEPDKTSKPPAEPKPDKPKPVKPKELEKPPPKKPQIKFPDEMGERTGTGIGSNKSEGPEPLKAMEADQDQAFLSRNPGAAGKISNRPVNGPAPPGEGGRGGHRGSATPAGSAKSASNEAPVPAEPLANQAPRPQQTDPAAEATPPAPPDLPVPPAQLETAALKREAPAEAVHRQPDVNETAQATPAPIPPPPPAAALELSAVSIGPKISPTPPKPGDEATKGAGLAGIEGESMALPNDAASGLRRTTTQPSREAGHNDGAPVALQLPVPFITPTRIAEPKVIPAQPPARALALLMPPPAAPTPEPAQPAIQQPSPGKPEARKDILKPTPVQHSPPPPPASPAPEAGAAAVARATGDGRPPGSERPSGEPGQLSDSEMDPFSKIGSAELLHDGKLDVRFGRKIKTVRPHLPVVGQVDSFALLNPSVTLRVSIDATGKVTEVSVHKSSGSNEIDQPTLIAMYDWWFEPLHDDKGNAVPDTVLFTINFR